MLVDVLLGGLIWPCSLPPPRLARKAREARSQQQAEEWQAVGGTVDVRGDGGGLSFFPSFSQVETELNGVSMKGILKGKGSRPHV